MDALCIASFFGVFPFGIVSMMIWGANKPLGWSGHLVQLIGLFLVLYIKYL